MPEYTFSPISPEDGSAIIGIFNHYIEHGFAAFPEECVPKEFFSLFLEVSRHYPSVVVKEMDGTVAGFGLLRPHNPMTVFRHTAEITYFIRPDLTGKGIGTRMLEILEAAGQAKGIKTILADISSLNEGSIRFHAKNGFADCGRFARVGRKKGTYFDTVWMQKFL